MIEELGIIERKADVRTGPNRWNREVTLIADGVEVRVETDWRKAANGAVYVVASVNQADWFAEDVLRAILARPGVRAEVFGPCEVTVTWTPDYGRIATGVFVNPLRIIDYVLG